MGTMLDEVNETCITRCVGRIQELTSPTDFKVSAELLQSLDDLWMASNKDLSCDIINAINSVNGARTLHMWFKEMADQRSDTIKKDVLVRIVSILSGKSGSLSPEAKQCLHRTYLCIYNLSDEREFAKKAANTFIVTKCIQNLMAMEKFISKDSQIDEDLADVIDFSLGIIYNISKEENVQCLFGDDLSLLHRYKNAEREDFVAMAVMILAHLSDGDAEKIQDEKETTVYLINLLQRAINEEDRRAVGFSSNELIEALGHLALNDSNKYTIVEKDGVPILLGLLRSQREEEQIAAAQCLWTLAFLPSIQKKLQQCRGKFEALSKSCSSNVLRKTLEGILHTLEKQDEKTKDRQSKDGHIMISYAWDGGYGEQTARKIASNLKSRGLKVWIDTDEMKGSFLDAMAQAVSDSYAFVLCVSDKYRKSNNCRLEASSAHIQNKLIIPAVVGSSIHSKSDWLMLLCADKLYVDFTNEDKFHRKCEELVQQIVRLSNDEVDVVVPVRVHETTSQPNDRVTVSKWSPREVKIWMKEHALQCFEEEFEEFSGSELMRLRKIQHDAPEFFYRYFCEPMDGREKRKLIDVIKLTEAIEHL